MAGRSGAVVEVGEWAVVAEVDVRRVVDTGMGREGGRRGRGREREYLGD